MKWCDANFDEEWFLRKTSSDRNGRKIRVFYGYIGLFDRTSAVEFAKGKFEARSFIDSTVFFCLASVGR